MGLGFCLMSLMNEIHRNRGGSKITGFINVIKESSAPKGGSVPTQVSQRVTSDGLTDCLGICM